ncbi:hypothetical protein EJ04DRAFT_537764 [Polyplosphaeria fusca]|uniref:Tafazzin n=1 Tax=Polyplosphaeria fusca TaxID=682080 RepID=A0A9P4UWR1_9PLEO|nr:hypothetical protein EJ04DRAFT_537764 [Polyplosphaeria fusca]
MPKKHAPKYAPKPSPAHPSLESTRASSSSTPAPPQTVNERIHQLRREQTPRLTPERRDEFTQTVTTRTVPPHLRRILHMAEVDPPLPKPGTRSRVPRAGPRPPPGPAVPSSWLERSRHAPKLTRKRNGDNGPVLERFSELARVHESEYKRFPPVPSLTHFTLKAFSINWQELAVYEQHYLPAIPILLKEVLLSYISLYGAPGALDFKTLKILFSNESEVEGATGSEDVRLLDLSGLLNENFTLSDLAKCLGRPLPAPAQSVASISTPVVDSWEDEADSTPVAPLPSNLSLPTFPNLTRLSLAHPGPQASWTGLLSLSTKLHTLTHLSLAHWPVPSTTPNAKTTDMVSAHTKVSLGGSHFYSETTDDWHEASNILRRLSLNTYCLRWLDLEGCTWHAALTWRFPRPQRPHPARTSLALDMQLAQLDEWVPPASAPGPDWNDAWRQVEYLRLAQGWVPRDQHAIMAMPAGVIAVEVLGWLRAHENEKEVRGRLRKVDSWAAAGWVEREKGAREVAASVNAQRKGGKGKWCVVDHGWDPDAVELGLRRKEGEREGG